MATPKIFVSYSHADIKQKERLLQHLVPLENSVQFEVWTDTQIQAGTAWQPEIERALSSADVAILLITANFLGSDFVRRKEVPVMLERREKEDLRLYPILAKPCAWQAVPWISETQVRPVAARAVWRSGGRYVDDELTRIALELWGIIKLVIQVHDAADEKSKQQAVEQRREKEKVLAQLVASSPAPESVDAVRTDESNSGLLTVDSPGLDLDEEALARVSDQQQAQEIYRQIVADAEANKVERARILQDLQKQIFSVTQDVTLNRTKSIDHAYTLMDEYIRG
jgi:hypothetical protein